VSFRYPANDGESKPDAAWTRGGFPWPTELAKKATLLVHVDSRAIVDHLDADHARYLASSEHNRAGFTAYLNAFDK